MIIEVPQFSHSKHEDVSKITEWLQACRNSYILPRVIEKFSAQ
jgi:hypothetical protein